MRSRFVAIVVLVALVATAGVARSQPTGSANASPHDFRPLQLGPHAFAPMLHIGLPLVRTYLRTSVGVGKAFDVKVPVLVIDTVTVVGLSGDLMFATLDFKYQHAVKNWMAVWADVQLIGRLGTGIQSLLAEGVSAALGLEFGTLFRLYESRRVYLSATAKLTNASATVVNVLDFVEGIVDSGRVVSPLVRNTPVLAGGAGLRAAWSISPLFGVYGRANLGLTEAARAGEATRVSYDVGAVADFDLGAVGFIPVGVAAGYTASNISIQSPSADVAHVTVLAFSYRGRPDFNINLEIAWEWLPSAVTSQTIKGGMLLLTTQYFF